MSLGITIDINGQVVERIYVRQTVRLDDEPGGRRRYTVTEAAPATNPREFKNALVHRRSDGALKLAAKAVERVMKERRPRR